jgi:hypothetical protein
MARRFLFLASQTSGWRNKRDLLYDVLPNELPCALDILLVDGFLNEVTNDTAVVLRSDVVVLTLTYHPKHEYSGD